MDRHLFNPRCSSNSSSIVYLWRPQVDVSLNVMHHASIPHRPPLTPQVTFRPPPLGPLSTCQVLSCRFDDYTRTAKLEQQLQERRRDSTGVHGAALDSKLEELTCPAATCETGCRMYTELGNPPISRLWGDFCSIVLSAISEFRPLASHNQGRSRPPSREPRKHVSTVAILGSQTSCAPRMPAGSQGLGRRRATVLRQGRQHQRAGARLVRAQPMMSCWRRSLGAHFPPCWSVQKSFRDEKAVHLGVHMATFLVHLDSRPPQKPTHTGVFHRSRSSDGFSLKSWRSASRTNRCCRPGKSLRSDGQKGESWPVRSAGREFWVREEEGRAISFFQEFFGWV